MFYLWTTIAVHVLKTLIYLLQLDIFVVYAFSFCNWASSVSCVTWCSATNQRSALTTTRYTARPMPRHVLMLLQDRTSVTFAVWGLQLQVAWSDTWRPFTPSVTSRRLSVVSAHMFSSKKWIYPHISSAYTNNSKPWLGLHTCTVYNHVVSLCAYDFFICACEVSAFYACTYSCWLLSLN